MIRQLMRGLCLCLALFFVGTTQASADDLDYGIYWYGYGDDYRKAEPNSYNPYFDPRKPTVIFIHGWQQNAIRNGTHESFNYFKHDQKYGFNENTADYWTANWNIGVFYWREFADETDVLVAESKVWSTRGLFGMRMKVKRGNQVVTQQPPRSIAGKTVADLFFDSYKSAMRGYTGTEVRLVGHSLGNQVVMAGGEKIVDAIDQKRLPANLKPTRVALLDPFYSNQFKPFWRYETTGEKAAKIATKMKNKGVLFEFHRTSIVPAIGQVVGALTFDDDSLLALRKMSAHQDMKTHYISWDIKDIGKKHISAHYLYFQSMNYDAPKEIRYGGWERRGWFRYWNPFKRVETGASALSARTPNWRVRQMMTDRYYWVQDGGERSADTRDNQYKIVPRW